MWETWFLFSFQFCGFKSLEKKSRFLLIIFKLKIKNSKKNCHYNVKSCHKKEKKRATLVGNFFENINENFKKKP
jgi:putative IMPACT (imprinted ancient) family translation regulator